MASFNIEKRFTLQTVLATVCNCRGLIVLKLARYISPCLGKTSTGLLSLYVCVHNSATCDQCQFQLYYQTISAHQPLKLDDDAETEVLAASESTRSTWSTWSTYTPPCFAVSRLHPDLASLASLANAHHIWKMSRLSRLSRLFVKFYSRALS
ncbi:unnamed protein product [Cladocopium goreaui]|uniref:Uncharacterized protein n=1 Tax=Cladocopium goreaui TaxID=2562237 RepID=A0A9P1DIJ3_9DINO|nr:unnamed protein product [Cladocopium goreaui]